jgi:hypothetical protein
MVPTRPRVPGLIARVTLVMLVMLAFPLRASADNVTDLINQLRTGEDKIRLSAALGLSKLKDQRGVQPLINALKDSDRNVRAAAANGLGKLVTAKSKESVRKAAAAALATAAQKDSSDIVKRNATTAAELIDAIAASTTTVPKGGVYIDVGPMTATDAKLKEAMRKTTIGTFGKSAKSMATAWPGGKAPSASVLTKAGVQGFHVDGTVVEVKSSGGMVSCKISMLIATYPDKSMFGFLKGGASVQGGTNEALDKADCVSAVIEDMVMKKIIPAIKTKAGLP